MTPRRYSAFTGQAANHLKRDGLSLYLQLERILRGQINSGQFKPGDTFPTEDQISGEYGVSRITVREALRILTNDGLLVRRSGKRTLVSNKPPFGAYLTAFALEDLIHGGHEAETRRELISLKVLPANLPVVKALQIPLKTKMLEVHCVLYTGDLPFAHVAVTTPFKHGRHIPKERFAEKPMIALLAEICNVRVGEMDQWTTVSQAEKRIADRLGVNVDAPIAVVRRVYYDYEQRPFELSVIHYRGDRFRHHLHLRGERLTSSEQEVHQ